MQPAGAEMLEQKNPLFVNHGQSFYMLIQIIEPISK